MHETEICRETDRLLCRVTPRVVDPVWLRQVGTFPAWGSVPTRRANRQAGARAVRTGSRAGGKASRTGDRSGSDIDAVEVDARGCAQGDGQ
jgi:hypothetical protein